MAFENNVLDLKPVGLTYRVSSGITPADWEGLFMKFSKSVTSTSLICVGFSLGLLGCGSGSSSPNPSLGGTGGAVTSIAATCPNRIDASSLNAPATEGAGFEKRTNYTLSSLEIYVYDPGTGNSFSASVDSSDHFQVPSHVCNGTLEGGRHKEVVSVPESLDSRDSEDLTMTANFSNRQLDGISSSVGKGDEDFLGLDQLGQGPELSGSDRFVSSRAFLSQRGDLEIRSETQYPVDRTGNRKLVFVSAQYEVAVQPAPGRPQPGRPPGGHPDR
jgi:hypothetical protein